MELQVGSDSGTIYRATTRFGFGLDFGRGLGHGALYEATWVTVCATT
jgi:hypothetical protein